MHRIRPLTNLELLSRSAIGTALVISLTLVGSLARATEIIPSIGMTNAVDEGDESARVLVGLALRQNFGPITPEIGITYRTEERFDGVLRQRMWPVTASLWLTPIPVLYAGAGVGWYYTTFDFDQDRVPLLQDETRQDFGVHVGGGLRFPIAPAATLDVHGRYVMMQDQDSRLVPETFDPDFWSLSAGLGFNF
ncbi:MAG: outer membrane beta-barrel protein [Candidatus Eisenbacteria bacterium]|uniref:Outer membrane beta-barrel protein n=1 Tax=Eiseniibacteriota bacterium TaxID=2212470 RepID=A0A849SHX8_UNCEI|nr:outer membrane beta-barrel protein [Candidatus Eisenbacteria bacterium]